MQILGQLTGQGTEQSAPPSAQTRQAPPANDQQAEFVRSILGDTEDTWRAVFAQNGREYKDPTLVLFSGQVNSACGRATSATGPFIARQTSRFIWTWISSARCLSASRLPATLPRLT